MKAYTFSFKTNEFLSEVTLMLDPVSKVALIPAGATNIEPPALQEGFARVFKDGTWGHELDVRGNYYDGTGKPVKWNELGELPQDYTDAPLESDIELYT